jgi:predicted membrane GTPase involved in stress response
VARADSPTRTTGALVADRPGLATAYAIYNLQERGEIFIDRAGRGLRGDDRRRERPRRTTST